MTASAPVRSSAAPILSGEGLGKRFRVVENRSLAAMLKGRPGPTAFWALEDVNLELYGGEVLAVIGRNGAGKSTLLKLCAGVSVPTVGTVRRPERIAPLIEVGAGFHPELTGRENIAVNGRLLGLSRRDVRARFDDIVDFSQLGDSIDRPVRQYSSGMFMRLGFSVAVHTKPEMLIVDEVLAVGDLTFQVRCLERIKEMREDGVGILFVSHNLGAVLTLATRAMLLVRGKVTAVGDVQDVVGAYHQSLSNADARAIGDTVPTSELVLESLIVTDEHGQEPALWQPGQLAELRFVLRAVGDVAEGLIGFDFTRDGAGRAARWVNEDGPMLPPMCDGERLELLLRVRLNLAEGGYTLDVTAGPRDLRFYTMVSRAAFRFGIGARRGGTGIADLAPEMTVRPLP